MVELTVVVSGWTVVVRFTANVVAVSSKVMLSVSMKLVAVPLVTSFQLFVPPTPAAVPTSQLPLTAPVHFTVSVPLMVRSIFVFTVS